MTTTTEHDYEKTLRRYTELDEQRRQIEEEQRELKAELATLGLGSHNILGVKVTVTAPSRKFNLDRAITFLNDEQKKLAMAPDPAKVKQFLPPVLLEQSMDAGTGNPIVRVA